MNISQSISSLTSKFTTSMKKKQIDDLLKRELFLTFDECTQINFTKS